MSDRRRKATLTVFAPPAKHLEERRRDAEREPESAEAALELGIAEADAGLFDAAMKSLEKAERLAKREPAFREEARKARHATLLTAARSAADNGKRDDAEGYIGKAVGTEYSPMLRVQARRLLAEQLERFGDAAGAVAAWQALIDDAELRGVRVPRDSGLPCTAGQMAEDRIRTLIKKHGAAAYAAIEKRTRAQYDGAPKGTERAAALERLTVDYPNAVTRRVALRELIDLYSKSGREHAEEHASDRLRRDPGPEDDVEALLWR